MKIKPLPLSNCCGALLIAVSGAEGTSYYTCARCHKPCDPVSQPIKENKFSHHIAEMIKHKPGLKEKLEREEALLEDTPPVVPGDSKIIFLCTPCDIGYATREEFREHLRVTHSDIYKSMPEPSVQSSPEGNKAKASRLGEVTHDIVEYISDAYIELDDEQKAALFKKIYRRFDKKEVETLSELRTLVFSKLDNSRDLLEIMTAFGAYNKKSLSQQKKQIRDSFLARMPEDEEINFEENNEPAIRRGILLDFLELLED